MTALDVFAFVVLTVLVGAGLWLAFLLGELPGRLARDRGHPQADAIRVAGWFGLVTLGLLWPLALIWAYTRPGEAARSDDLTESLTRVETRLVALERTVNLDSGSEEEATS